MPIGELNGFLSSAVSNFTVAEYLAWVRSALGESTYQNLLQSSPQALNFDRVITLEEQYLYGSKRLGVRRPGLEMARAAHNPSGYEVPVEPPSPTERFGNDCLCNERLPDDEEPYYPGAPFTARFYTHTLGMKEYEITNHLGNVLATVLDRKTGVKASPTATTYAWFKADVTTAQDYYPFGSLMPGRTYVASTGVGYRFGFNGMQRDDEIKGPGNSLDFGARMYDSRLGRLWSNDPRWREFPAWSVYSYASNSPILFIDEEGEGPGHSILKWLANETDGTWSVQSYGSIAIGVVKTSARGMAVDKYGNVALLMSQSFGTQGLSAGASVGVATSFYPKQSIASSVGPSMSFGAQVGAFNMIEGGATIDLTLNKGRVTGGSISFSAGIGPSASPISMSPVLTGSMSTGVLLSQSEFRKIEKGYSKLLNRTSELNSKKDATGYYAPISSSLDFRPTGNEGEFEAVLLQKYEYRPYTGGAANQVITETLSTGIKLDENEGNLRSRNLKTE